MFALIWYFGLISFAVSANSKDYTLDGGNVDMTTTSSDLSSKASSFDKDCGLKMKKSQILEIAELFKSDRVHVVDIRVSFSGNAHHQKLLSEFHVKLLNPIGREILYTLEKPQFKYVTWTLNPGIKSFTLDVEDGHNDCVYWEEDVVDFTLKIKQNLVSSINVETNYEIWYPLRETVFGELRQICCQITKYNLQKCNVELCSDENSFLYGSGVPWEMMVAITFFGFFCGVTSLLFVFLSRTEFNLKYPNYYKLGESSMSPFSVLFKIVWEECGGKCSFVRSCSLLGVIFGLIYLFWGRIEFFGTLLFLLWGLIFSIPCVYKPKITNSDILAKINRPRTALNHFLRVAKGFVHDSNVLQVELHATSEGGRGWFIFEYPFGIGNGSGVLVDFIELLTLPFNVKFWGDMSFHDFVTTCLDEHCKNRFFKNVLLGPCCVLEIVVSFVFVCVAIVISVVYVAFVCPVTCLFQLLFLVESLKYSLFEFPFCCLCILWCIDFLGLLFVVGFSCYVVSCAIQSIVLGLFLNLIYFIPYFASIAVLLFYCGNYWKSVEEMYLVLKRLIYEECRVQCVDDGCIPNRHPKQEERVLPVVSQGLYDKIREKLLPYHKSLFYFGLKMLCVLVFSFVIFELINMLHEFNITGFVQVVTTASLGVIPHVFNVVALKTNDEKKEAFEEKLKLNVKYMVKDLVRENSELVRTVLIMQKNNTGTNENVQNRSDNRRENASDFELLEIMSDNDDESQHGNDQPGNEPVNQPVNEPVNEPMNQPVNGPVNQPTNQPMNQPVNEPVNQPVNQPVNEPVNEPMNQPVNEPVNQPVNQPVNKPVNQPVNP